MCELAYNYIFLSVNEDYFEPLFGGLRMVDNVRLLKSGIDSKNAFLQHIFKLHWSAKINRRVKLPLRRLWYKRMYGKDFGNDKPTCFVFLGAQYARQDNGAFMDYVKAQNPKNKCVLIFLDLLKADEKTLEMLRSKADLITTYEKNEAERHGFTYFEELIYSKPIENPINGEPENDVHFLGYAKNRLKAILDVYRRLNEAGVKCDFNIVGVPKEQQIEGEGLHFVGQLPYKTYLERMLHSKCILEINQVGAQGATMRALEAVAYGRKLLTNSKQLTEKPFYNPSQMKSFTDVDSIDIDFAKRSLSDTHMLEGFDLSPKKRLRFIEEHLK